MSNEASNKPDEVSLDSVIATLRSEISDWANALEEQAEEATQGITSGQFNGQRVDPVVAHALAGMFRGCAVEVRRYTDALVGSMEELRPKKPERSRFCLECNRQWFSDNLDVGHPECTDEHCPMITRT